MGNMLKLPYELGPRASSRRVPLRNEELSLRSKEPCNGGHAMSWVWYILMFNYLLLRAVLLLLEQISLHQLLCFKRARFCPSEQFCCASLSTLQNVRLCELECQGHSLIALSNWGGSCSSQWGLGRISVDSQKCEDMHGIISWYWFYASRIFVVKMMWLCSTLDPGKWG